MEILMKSEILDKLYEKYDIANLAFGKFTINWEMFMKSFA